ncbi:MAG: cytochrome c [Planctomycetes bacterium]|nr:cytochrome c [Planctomycetota bacterium]
MTQRCRPAGSSQPPRQRNSLEFRCLVVAMLLGAAGCLAQSARRAESDAPAAEDKGSRHWVYDRQLRDIMVDLQRGTDEHWPQELDEEHVAGASPRYRMAFEEAAPLAAALAHAADRIPGVVGHLKMGAADRRSFAAQADTLRDQARQLEAAARDRDRDSMRNVLDAINATCQSCHARFLDYSGPLSANYAER